MNQEQQENIKNAVMCADKGICPVSFPSEIHLARALDER